MSTIELKNSVKALIDLIQHEYPELYKILESEYMIIPLNAPLLNNKEEYSEYLTFLRKRLKRYIEFELKKNEK